MVTIKLLVANPLEMSFIWSNGDMSLDGTTCAMYDAYINCAEKDILLAKEMLNTLESSPHNLRLFLPERQLMPGGCKYEDIADVLEDR